MYFGNNLRFLRKSKNLKTSETLVNIGFKPSQWSNYENEISFPKFLDLIKISKYFGVKESDLIHTDLKNNIKNNQKTENKQYLIELQREKIDLQREKIQNLEKEILSLKKSKKEVNQID